MATRSRKSATQAAVEESTGQLTQDMTDEEIMAAVQAETEKRKAALATAPPPAPRTVSVEELYGQFIALIKGYSSRNPRNGVVSEQTAVKCLELTLFWALNNRQNTAPTPVFDPVEIGGEVEPDEAPTPDETIGFDTDADEEIAA